MFTYRLLKTHGFFTYSKALRNYPGLKSVDKIVIAPALYIFTRKQLLEGKPREADL